MLRINMVCHLWDLVDHGVDEVLDRLQGELGVSGVSVPVVCSPAALLRLGTQASPRIFRTRGGAFFRPDDRYYQATRCRPVVADWLKGRNPLEQVARGCRKRDLGFRVSVCTSLAGRFASRYPEGRAKTVFGDPWEHRLCLVNPDVQALMVGLCRDLADTYAPDAIELHELHVGRFGPSFLPVDPGVDLGPAGRTLLAICFCESCRQLAGTGVAGAAADYVTERLQRTFESGIATLSPPTEALAEDAALQSHVQRQWRSVNAMLNNIQAECPCECVVQYYEDCIITDVAPEASPTEESESEAVQRLFRVSLTDMDAFDQQVRGAISTSGAAGRTELIVPAHAGSGEETGSPTQALVRGLSRAAELGVAGVNLDNYGQLPSEGRTVVKQAVRFARRKPAGEQGH